jgi:FemAB-related protein (PEP-CTERM system-associated)
VVNVEAATALPLVIREVRDGERRPWQRFVEHHPDATFFHQWSYRTVVEESFGHRAHYLVAERGDEVVGVLPLFEMKSLLFGHSLVSVPFGVYGGAVADDGGVQAALYGYAQELARDRGVDYLELRYMVDSGLPAPTHDLFYTFRREISADHDANLKAIPRKQRRMVRQGERHGLTYRTGPAELDTVYELYAESVHRLGTPVYSRRFFRSLQTILGDDCHCLTVWHEDRAVAGVMSFFFKDQVLPYYAGSRVEYRNLAPNDYMYWQLMRLAAERGVRVFDFGRSKRGTGAFDFKVHWGFDPQSMPYVYYAPDGGPPPQINTANPGYRRRIEMWKRLPLWLSKLLGPRIIRSIP